MVLLTFYDKFYHVLLDCYQSIKVLTDKIEYSVSCSQVSHENSITNIQRKRVHDKIGTRKFAYKNWRGWNLYQFLVCNIVILFEIDIKCRFFDTSHPFREWYVFIRS